MSFSNYFFHAWQHSFSLGLYFPESFVIEFILSHQKSFKLTVKFSTDSAVEILTHINICIWDIVMYIT